MSITIPHSKPSTDAKDAKAAYDVITSGHLARGEKVAAFEQALARFQKVKYAVATSSGTAALHLSLLAMDIKKGDNVIIPSFVCTALLNAIHYTGASACVVDIDRDDFNISVKDVKKKINKRTKAIIVPHMFGTPADIGALLKLGIPLIEDCAQSLGAMYRGKPVGSFGVLSVYSFYATKMMTTGEGGLVTSNNRQLISRIKDLYDYDQRRDYKVRYNYKMTDIQAALGISQLSKLPGWIKRRRTIALMYHRGLRDCGFDLPIEKSQREHVYFRYVLRAKKNKPELLKALMKKGIQCATPVYKPLHQYLNLKGYGCADQAMKESLSLPIYPSLSNDNVQYIIKHIKAM